MLWVSINVTALIIERRWVTQFPSRHIHRSVERVVTASCQYQTIVTNGFANIWEVTRFPRPIGQHTSVRVHQHLVRTNGQVNDVHPVCVHSRSGFLGDIVRILNQVWVTDCGCHDGDTIYELRNLCIGNAGHGGDVLALLQGVHLTTHNLTQQLRPFLLG